MGAGEACYVGFEGAGVATLKVELIKVKKNCSCENLLTLPS